MIKNIIFRLIANTFAIWLTAYLIRGFVLTGDIKDLFLAALVLGLLNAVVKPIVSLIAFPLILLSLGLFSLVINAGILYLLDYFFDSIAIADKASLIMATLVISGINLVISRKL